MLRLNRTTEYGLIALRHFDRKRRSEASAVTSAREIADTYGLPFEITAKTLQRLRDSGLIESAQGARGGYSLQRELSEVTLAEFLEGMEGQHGIVACADPGTDEKHECCEYSGRCEMKGVLNGLNRKLLGFLKGIRLDELVGADEPETQMKVFAYASLAGARAGEK